MSRVLAPINSVHLLTWPPPETRSLELNSCCDPVRATTMTAPPARPHILKSVNAPARWSLASVNDWGEDDAWDSGSDSESKAAARPTKVKSPSHSVISNISSTSSKGSKSMVTVGTAVATRPDPIPISPPRKNSLTGGTRHRESPSSHSTSGANRSSSSVNNLSFSFTHVQHPSPSSYPPASTLSSHPESEDADWQEQERDERERAGWTIVRTDYDGPDRSIAESEEHDPELDGSLVVGDIEPGVFQADDSEDEPVREGKDAIVPDCDDIVKGILSCYLDRATFKLFLFGSSIDPMFSVRKAQLSQAAESPIASSSRSNSPSLTNGKPRSKRGLNAPLSRGRSLRSNRRYGKVVDCLSKPDVNMSQWPSSPLLFFSFEALTFYSLSR